MKLATVLDVCVLCYKYYHELSTLLAYIFIWYLLSTTSRLTFLNHELSIMINTYHMRTFL